MKRYIKILLSILFISLIACEEQTNVSLQESEPIIIVDALITSNNKPQTIRVMNSTSNLNEAPTPVSGATITLKTDIQSIQFDETSAGIYTSEAFAATTNTHYTLHIDVEGKSDSATATMYPVSELKDYYFTEKENGLLKYQYSGSDLPAMTDIYYNWENNTEYCTQFGSCHALQTYYTLNSFDLVEEFAPQKEEVLIPVNTKVVRRKYSLSPEHQEFIRSLLIETEWRGGIFDVEQGNVPTNFTNGLQGWFGVCQVISDSTLATAQ